jgi:teichuronic acid biosynthesis glycosyltransferase TuaC
LNTLHEGSPTVVKEALACNLPVVSVDVGDVQERLKGIEACYIASPDPDDLAAKLSLVYFGARRVAGRFKMQELSLESIALQLKRFYEDTVILSASSKTPKKHFGVCHSLN